MLKQKDIAKVASKLEIPVIVTDLLQGAEPFTDDAEYAIHEAISDMQPDSALLTIALSAAKVAGVRGLGASPAVQVLDLECRKIIEEYGALWLQNAENGGVKEDEAYDTLISTAEDLEGVACLLEDCMGFLERTNGDAAILCNIMSVQARAQAIVAEAYFEAMEAQVQVEPMIAASNIVQFPTKRV